MDHALFVILPVFIYAWVVVRSEGVVHSTAFASLGLGVVEAGAFITPVGATSTVNIVASRLLLSPGFTSRTSFQAIHFSKGCHHLALFSLVRVDLFSLLAGKLPMLRFFTKSAVSLLTVRASECGFSPMLVEEFTARSWAVDDLIILIELLLDAELLVL